MVGEFVKCVKYVNVKIQSQSLEIPHLLIWVSSCPFFVGARLALALKIMGNRKGCPYNFARWGISGQLLLSPLLIGLLIGCGLSLSKEPIIKPASVPPLDESKPYKEKLPKSELEEGVSELPELPITQPEEAPKDLFELSVVNANLQDVLLGISQSINYNVIIDPEITGSVTVELKDVTLEQLLDSILTPLNFEYKKEGNFLKIFKPKLETKIFTLNYVSVSRGGGGGGTAPAAAGGGAAPAGGGGGGGGGGAQSQIWEEIQTQLDTFKSVDGKVILQRSTSSIIVTDYPANLRKIEGLIRIAEAILRRQVMIQAQIIQVNLSNDHQMGIDWGFLSKISPLKLKGAAAGGSVVSQTLASGATPFQFGVVDGDFSFLIDAMQHQGQVEILSKPKISVLNNQPAIFRAGTNDVFWKTTTEVNPQTGQRTQTATPETITVGVVLNVVPQISIDGSMTCISNRASPIR